MGRGRSARFVSSTMGLLVSVFLLVALMVDIDPGSGTPGGRSAFGSYPGPAKPIGGARDNEEYYAPDGRNGWGRNAPAMQGGMVCEDSVRRGIAGRPGGVSDLSEEEMARLYDCLGQEMHLLQDGGHSSAPGFLLEGPPEK